MGPVRHQMCMCVQNTEAFLDYTFNPGVWKRCQTESSVMPPKAEYHSLRPATHGVQQLTETKTVGRVEAMWFSAHSDAEGLLIWVFSYNCHHNWGFRAMVKTHFSSLSSRNASFFCFLISSRLRRASARSLTARSLSRRRLSHRVLGKERKVMRI